MLLILVLALLFCPSLAEEELRGVKQKKYAYFILFWPGILYIK